MAELLLGLLIVVAFFFLIRYIINEKPEGNWDSPLLPEEAEQEQPALVEEPDPVTEEQTAVETGGNGDAGAEESIETPEPNP